MMACPPLGAGPQALMAQGPDVLLPLRTPPYGSPRWNVYALVVCTHVVSSSQALMAQVSGFLDCAPKHAPSRWRTYALMACTPVSPCAHALMAQAHGFILLLRATSHAPFHWQVHALQVCTPVSSYSHTLMVQEFVTLHFPRAMVHASPRQYAQALMAHATMALHTPMSSEVCTLHHSLVATRTLTLSACASVACPSTVCWW